ncbi:hypothetical protein CEUSTIGMA_g2431.t1 [Chlamydomonas eustigma]|uniref:Uncharacterized protein n=1 Tax=Chlamydomonas eustigma TaxID=1157962 RepID=A0A250WW12_9CHLO|nr:hypothetical protein CEUSTIGMA_g2431.t1 [Chlamydomonas eustigma]|eukprot:GAX74985.1 hypothetical protein CEUSTIGMA_g2431.t1 [Chlamydomonas eustigma]
MSIAMKLNDRLNLRIKSHQSRSITVRRIACRAEGEQVQTGYVDKDTAGQKNMFPVMTKAYEAGNENAQTTTANNSVAIVAGTVAVSAVVLGFSALSGNPGSVDASSFNASQLLTLVEYSSKFSAELGVL